MTKLNLVFLLLVIYQLKHWFADYPLQGKYMLGKFKGGWDWVLPLAAHCGVHMAMTFVIGMFFAKDIVTAIGLSLFDFTIHFTMDRIKASPNLLGRFKALSANEMKAILIDVPKDVTLDKKNSGEWLSFLGKYGNALKSNTYFWWALGLDQGVHHLTHYAIIYWLVS